MKKLSNSLNRFATKPKIPRAGKTQELFSCTRPMTNPKGPDDLWTFISDLKEKYQLSLASEVAVHISKREVAKMLTM